MEKLEIKKIDAIEILDSRAIPTVQARVTLKGGAVGIASVPSGASTGKYEAHELRDRDENRYGGKGTLRAAENIEKIIEPALKGIPAVESERCDHIMIALDGTRNKSNLGANTILSVSIAIAKAAAAALGIPFYRYLGGYMSDRLPIPMMNIINGGVHASNSIDIQEFMILPMGASSFAEGVRMCAEVYRILKREIDAIGRSSAVGDEGGFAPALENDECVLDLIMQSVLLAGLTPGRDIMLGLDVASGSWYDGEKYRMTKSQKEYSTADLIQRYERLCKLYPIYSIEDGLAEDDGDGWRRMTRSLGKDHMLVGDDLFVTNTERLAYGIKEGLGNAILIKPNQIGTLTETVAAISLAKRSGYKIILSHRSGDTADTAIADMAVAFGADFIKSGAPCRAERTEKYNRLIFIENEMFSPRYGSDIILN